MIQRCEVPLWYCMALNYRTSMLCYSYDSPLGARSYYMRHNSHAFFCLPASFSITIKLLLYDFLPFYLGLIQACHQYSQCKLIHFDDDHHQLHSSCLPTFPTKKPKVSNRHIILFIYLLTVNPQMTMKMATYHTIGLELAKTTCPSTGGVRADCGGPHLQVLSLITATRLLHLPRQIHTSSTLTLVDF